MSSNSSRFVYLTGLAGGTVLLVAYLLSTQVETSVPTLPFYKVDPATNKIEKTDVPGQKIGAFAFQNQLGKVYTQEDIGNAVFVADYFFAQCPGICKTMSSQMQRVSQAFEDTPHLKILSFTSKPEEDSVSALYDYALQNKVKDHGKWVFLTGDKKQLYKVAREQFFIVDEPGDGGEEDFIHTERFVLVDQNRYVRGYYDGTNPKEVDQLIHDIKDLLQE